MCRTMNASSRVICARGDGLALSFLAVENTELRQHRLRFKLGRLKSRVEDHAGETAPVTFSFVGIHSP